MASKRKLENRNTKWRRRKEGKERGIQVAVRMTICRPSNTPKIHFFGSFHATTSVFPVPRPYSRYGHSFPCHLFIHTFCATEAYKHVPISIVADGGVRRPASPRISSSCRVDGSGTSHPPPDVLRSRRRKTENDEPETVFACARARRVV